MAIYPPKLDILYHPNLDDSGHARISHPKVDVLYNPNLDDSEGIFMSFESGCFVLDGCVSSKIARCFVQPFLLM